MTEADPGFEELLAYLKEVRGFDFTGYKRSTLIRRVQRRMADVGDSSYADYRDRLELHAEEFTALFDTILINVTSFLRDPESWDYLRSDIVPELLAQRPTGPLRIWSAGCATGQEAYSLAIVLAEAMGWDQFRERVKIYATDVDEKALATARQASYSHRELHGLTPDLLERYFEPSGQRWSFRKDLRRAIIFGRNDLVQDAPISHVDLLLCRNTLMYFTAETQARIVQRLHFALNPAGALFLGKAEMLLSHGSLFTAVDLPRRFFRKVAVRPLDRVPVTATMTLRPAPEPTDPEVQRLREALMASSSAQLVLDASARVTLINRRADALFSLSARDVGRLFQDLEVSYRPVELRSAVQEAHTQRRAVLLRDVEWRRGTELLWLDIQVVPLLESDGRVVGTSLNFTDVSRSRQLREELEYANRQLETAYEELQSTNEELETTNEELQSTVEELETTNEELQSTNEELETMNEELHSTNDELQTINDELQDRTGDLDAANGFLETIFTSLRAGVVVLNTELHVRVWSRQAEELWGLRPEEAVGQHFLNLDIGLPTDRLRSLIRRTLADEDGSQEATVAAVNRRGRSIEVRVLGSGLKTATGEVTGVILTMEGVEGPATAGGT